MAWPGQTAEDRYFVGLDLGEAVDHSAAVALLRTALPERLKSSRLSYKYEVVGARRWPLKTSYSAVAADVAGLVRDGPLAQCTLGVDKTGVGSGVLELIRAARPNASVRPIFITGGAEVKQNGPGWNVPKMELVSTVNALLDSDRLTIPATIPESDLLGKELRQFRTKVTAAGNETAAADWRTRAHDDLVLALAIAAWLGEKGTQRFWVMWDGHVIDAWGVRRVKDPDRAPGEARWVDMGVMGMQLEVPASPGPRTPYDRSGNW
jgi:hypothetical protein